MADRFWVGGSGTWNTTNTANWSATDGGAGGASVPTSTDDVYFSGSSGAGTVTISGNVVCQSFITDYPTNSSVTFGATGATVQVYGVFFTLAGVAGSFTGQPDIQFLGSNYADFASNGKNIGNITVNRPSGGVFINGALTAPNRTITVTNGTFDTNGYNVTASSLSSSNSNTRTINLGSSTVTLTLASGNALNLTTITGLTFNAGTSQIICSGGTQPSFLTGGLIFNNVSFTGTSLSSPVISGANTFNNLSIAGRTSAGISNISFSSDQTINGTLTLSAGTNATMRTFVRSDTIGTTRTLTCAAVASLTDIDFRDITIAGAAAPVSGTRLGDCKGNSGITFGAAKTVYRAVGASNAWSSSASWAATLGGAGSDNNFPLAQDTAVFPTNAPSSGISISIGSAYNIGTIDMSARTSNTMTLATGTQTPAIYGNWINGTGTTLTGTGTLTFAGRGSQTITSAGKTFTQQSAIVSPGGTVSLADAFTSSFSGAGITLSFGSFSANGYAVTLQSFSSNVTSARSIDVGSSTWTLTGATAGNAWNCATSTNLTVTGTGTISLTSASAKTFAGGGIQTYPTLNQGGTGTLTVTGSNKFAGLTNTAIGRIQFTGGATNEFTSFDINGVAGNLLQLGSTSTTQAILKRPSDWNVGANSVDAGNNTGLSFTAGSNDYLSVSYINGQIAASASTIYYGATNITNIRFGSAAVSAVYYGSTKVF